MGNNDQICQKLLFNHILMDKIMFYIFFLEYCLGLKPLVKMFVFYIFALMKTRTSDYMYKGVTWSVKFTYLISAES